MQWLTYADNATKGATFDKQAYAEHKRHRVDVFIDYSEQFETVTGDTGTTFIPTDNEPF
jgi:hypothetical protein